MKFRDLMTSIERRVYGPDRFLTEAQATLALLKFCDDHGNTIEAVQDLRACLAALEVGERSNAVAAFRRIPLHPYGFDDWFPPVVLPMETGEYAWVVFKALVERWARLMSSLADKS
ncbi:MAG: hypothetical protein U9N87_13550 [Planctomycetota bacterium]|nr:hypothetical protein [Planctomycetota bacterium]